MYLCFLKMKSLEIFGVYQAVLIAFILKFGVCDENGVCDLRPLGTNMGPLPPDNRFQLEMKDIRSNLYIPKRQYEVSTMKRGLVLDPARATISNTDVLNSSNLVRWWGTVALAHPTTVNVLAIRLFSRDNVSTFIAFSISLIPDTQYNRANPRRPTILHGGTLELHPDSNNTKFNRKCENAIIQSDITPKKEVKVLWNAPMKNNKCVTIFALVAIQPDVWYNYEGPLSTKVCEDTRKADDMMPMENSNCQVCEDARYQVTFQGMWSHNTHPQMFPETQDLARFSDIVGASHSKEYNVYKYNFEASEGLKMLAEQGNTTKLEMEILENLMKEPDRTFVRTLIKASAPPRPNLSTVASFRVTRRHHQVSLATAILPSPDWFLGVSNLELCDYNYNRWENVTLNLYPMDAGTDSGKKFESANDETSPAQPIKSALIGNVKPEDMKPFARVLFHLVRTYKTPNCSENDEDMEEPVTAVTDGYDDQNGDGDNEETSRPDNREYRPQPEQTSTTSEEPASLDPETEESECPMTTWSEWAQCEGECIDNKVTSYQARFRQHAVPDPTPECIAKMSTEDFQRCEEECQAEEEADEENEEENEVEE